MIAYLYFNLNVEIYHMFIDFIIVVQLHLKNYITEGINYIYSYNFNISIH